VSKRSPLTTVVETMVFAPLGAALLLREQLPKLAEQGRQHAENRVRVARMVGEVAVKAGKKEVERRLASRPRPGATTASPVSSAAGPSATGTAAGSAGESVAAAETPVAAARTAATAVGAEGLTLVEERPDVEDLPIPGYDSLAASQVVERLASLTAAELDLVRRYEAGGRHRRTILHRIEQLVS